MIDLRSDTVTRPTEEMRRAMYDAEVGDDVHGEDPTVNELQNMAAEITGKESALLVSSGTMGNLVSLLTLTNRGEEIILGDQCHVYAWEGAGVPIFGGVSLNVVKNEENGTLNLDEVSNSINPVDGHKPTTSVVSIENTHNQCGGHPIDEEYIRNLKILCDEKKLKIHMDGARLFNAATALNTDVSNLTKYLDTVTFCLSKGLSCPVGSVICGSKDIILEAKRWRKAIGGGMRQAGVFAAAGIVALNNMVDRLAEDHENAKKIGNGLADIDGIEIDVDYIKTNIIRFSLKDKSFDMNKFKNGLLDNGVMISPSGGTVRMVTHREISHDDVGLVIRAVSKSIQEL
ncbi:MAG: low-specificity L-threonine aldolase [Chloroflexota bacterium]|nr:low-specificity L-threonine aldolase [Chloroflexota bacterium]